MGRNARRRHPETAIDRVIRTQIEPHLIAADLTAKGIDVESVIVDVSPDAVGFPVTCVKCGRTAMLNRDPGVKVGLCPDCIGEGKGE